MGLSGQAFLANQPVNSGLVLRLVGPISQSVPCPPAPLFIRGLRLRLWDLSGQAALQLGLSGQVLPAHQLHFIGLQLRLSGQVFPAPRLHITGLQLGLSGQVFPAHQTIHYRLAVGAIRTSVPCPRDYTTLQACGWGYQDKCSLPPLDYTLQACGWSYQDKCSLPTRLYYRLAVGAIRTSVPCPPDYITGLRLGLSGQVFPAHQTILQA